MYKILDVWNGRVKLNNIRKKQVLRMGQFNQIWQMLEERALMRKTKYNWKSLNVAYDLLSKFTQWCLIGEIFVKLGKKHYKLFQITTRTPSVKVAVQKILTWGFDFYMDTPITCCPIILYRRT